MSYTTIFISKVYHFVHDREENEALFADNTANNYNKLVKQGEEPL